MKESRRNFDEMERETKGQKDGIVHHDPTSLLLHVETAIRHCRKASEERTDTDVLCNTLVRDAMTCGQESLASVSTTVVHVIGKPRTGVRGPPWQRAVNLICART